MKTTLFMPNRRQFILGSLGAVVGRQTAVTKKRVAAIVTEYRYYSHADVIVGRMLDGYYPNGVRKEPRTRIERAVGVWYGGVEVYGFHGLEALQSVVERRAGAEQGIAAVSTLQGEAVWKWREGADGGWSAPLLQATLACSRSPKPGAVEQNVKKPVLFLLEYRDGFRAALYYLDGHTQDFLFAAKLQGRSEPVATCFGASGGRPLKHFDGLVDCIEEMFVTGRPVYPVKRTLLTSGALDFLMDSLYKNRRIETPELKLKYRAPARAYFQRD